MSRSRPFTAPKVSFPTNFPRPIGDRDAVDRCRDLNLELMAGRISGDEFFRGIAEIRMKEGPAAMAVVSSVMLYLVHVRPPHATFVEQFVDVMTNVMHSKEEFVQRAALQMVGVLAGTPILPAVFAEITQRFYRWSDSAKEMFLAFAFSFKIPTVAEFLIFLPLAEKETRASDPDLASTAGDFIAFMGYVTGKLRAEPRIRNSIDFTKDQLRRSIDASTQETEKSSIAIDSELRRSVKADDAEEIRRSSAKLRESMDVRKSPKVREIDETPETRRSNAKLRESREIETRKSTKIDDELRQSRKLREIDETPEIRSSNAKLRESRDIETRKSTKVSDELRQSRNLREIDELPETRRSSAKLRESRDIETRKSTKIDDELRQSRNLREIDEVPESRKSTSGRMRDSQKLIPSETSIEPNRVSQSLRQSIKAASIKDSIGGFELSQLMRSSVTSEAGPINFELLKDSVISDETRMLMAAPSLQEDTSLNFPRISSGKQKSPRSSLTESTDQWDPRKSSRSPKLISATGAPVRDSQKSLTNENSKSRASTKSLNRGEPELLGEINVEQYLREIADNIHIDTAILDDDTLQDTGKQTRKKSLEETAEDDDYSDSKLFGGDPVFQLPTNAEELDEEIDDDDEAPISVTVKPTKVSTARQKREDVMSITAPPKKANLTARPEARPSTNYIEMLNDSDHWERQQQAVDIIRRTLDTNPISLAPQAKEIWTSLRDLVVSPRTMLANASLTLAGSLFKIFSQELSQHAPSMVPTFFDLIHNSHQFISDGADHILKLIAQKAPRAKVWRGYLTATKHKSAVTRGKAAQCMKSLIAQGKLNDKEFEAAIQHLAPLLRDKQAETREAAKSALLSITNDARFENVAVTTVKNSQDYKELMALVE